MWVVGIPKNRCRTTVAEPIGANASGTALTGDQAGLFKAQLGRRRVIRDMIELATSA